MKIDNLKYSKSQPSESPLAGVDHVEPKHDTDSPISGLGATETEYAKGSPTLETRLIFVLSGGSVREQDYFRPFKTDANIRSVKIAFRSKDGQGLKPYELKGLCGDFLNNKKFVMEDNSSFHIEEGDSLFILQDVDEFGDEIKKILNAQVEDNGAKWIISNPCFEMWLFYHYHSDTSLLSDCVAMSEKDRSNWLKEYLPKIIPGGVKTTKAFYSTEVAMANSKLNYSEEAGFPSLFSTQMHFLAETILQTMGEEYSAVKKLREDRIAFYKNLGGG